MASGPGQRRSSSICVPDANTLIDSRGKLHIVYKIHVRSGSYHRTISKKYSEFRLFDKIWRLMYSSIDVKLPPKIWIGNKTDRVVADRKIGLTKYLNALVVMDTLSGSLSKFLAVPVDILDKIKEEVKVLGPCCDKYGAGCDCLAASDHLSSSTDSNDQGQNWASNNTNNYNNNSNQRLASVAMPNSQTPASRVTSQQFDQSDRSLMPQLKCVRRFEARTPGQLSLFVGEIIQELKHANGWYYGRNGQGQEGYFPSDHVQKI